jgi:hypothetical protein
MVSVLEPPPLQFQSLYSSYSKVGEGLQYRYPTSPPRVQLDAPAPTGGTTVTITSADPTQILLSTSATGVPTGSIDLFVAAGATVTPYFYLHGAAGAPHNVGTTVQASAPGYQNATSVTLSVVPPVYYVESLSAAVSVGETDEFYISTGALQGAGSGFVSQPRGLGTLATFVVTSSNGLVGEIRNSATSGSSLSIDLGAGQSNTATTLGTGGIGFRGLSSGTTSVSATSAGFQACGSVGYNCGSFQAIVNVNVP